MCDWDVQQGWVLTKRLEGFETSGKVLFSEGDSVVVHVLQHAPIHVKKVFISKVHEKYWSKTLRWLQNWCWIWVNEN